MKKKVTDKSSKKTTSSAGSKKIASTPPMPATASATESREQPSPSETEVRRRAEHRHDERETDRRIARYDAAIAARTRDAGENAGPVTERMAIAAHLRAKPALRIIAEGDSWFDYPLEGDPFRAGDVISRLEDIIPYPILKALPTRGDETRFMLGVKQRAKLKALLEDRTRDFNVLLFSGGGNDLVGDSLRLWLRKREAVNGNVKLALSDVGFGGLLNLVRIAYEDLLDLRDEIVAKSPGRSIKVFLHEYDWAIPSGSGVCGYGPWLKPSLDDRNWHDPSEARAVVQEMLVRFAAMLGDVARQYTDVIVVKTQGTLQDSEWHNELHPNRAGFRKIAAKFKRALQEAFPRAIPD